MTEMTLTIDQAKEALTHWLNTVVMRKEVVVEKVEYHNQQAKFSISFTIKESA